MFLIIASLIWAQTTSDQQIPPTPFGNFIEAALGGGPLRTTAASMSGPELSLSWMQKNYTSYSWGIGLGVFLQSGTVYQEDDPVTEEYEQIEDYVNGFTLSLRQRLFLEGEDSFRPYVNMNAGILLYRGKLGEYQEPVSGMDFQLGGGFGVQFFLLPLIYFYVEANFNYFLLQNNDFDNEHIISVLVGCGAAL